jgi:hypothetical protein
MIDVAARLHEPAANKGGDVLVVLDDQNTHCV